MTAFCHSASALCLSESYLVLSVPKKKTCLKVSLRQSTRARKVNHNTSSVFLPAYAICAQVTHTACVWFAWEQGKRRRLSRGGWLLRDPPSTFASLALVLRQSGGSARGVRSEIWWRHRKQASLYLHPHLSDPMTAPRDWKHARWILPLGAVATVFLLSSSEEVDIGNAGEIAPSLSPQYEELVEVITHAVAKLSLDWPAERFIEPQRGKLDECFLQFKTSSSHRSLPFFPDLTLRCRGCGEKLSRPASSSLLQITIVMWGGRASVVTERCRQWNRRSRVICSPI